MSHPFPMHERWNACLWAPLILKPIKKETQLLPTSRAAPATIWERSSMGREGLAALGDLCESWWPSMLSCKLQFCRCSPQRCLQNLLPPAWNLGGEPQKGTWYSFYTEPTSRKFLIHPSRAYSDPLHLFNWHNMTRAYKRGLVVIPVPSLRRCPSQTANDPSQIAPAIYCDPPTMPHRIRDEWHMLGLHPSCPSHGPLTPSSPEWLTDPSLCTWAHAPFCWPQLDGQLNWAKVSFGAPLFTSQSSSAKTCTTALCFLAMVSPVT